MGEVIIADRTVTGAGVVQAQRVEQLADSGGVCITAAIHESLSKRMPFEVESLGEQVLKGFNHPVHVYRVALNPGESIPPAEEGRHRDTPIKTRRLMLGVVIVALVLAGGAAYWFKSRTPPVEVASVERMAFPLPDKPSIAVLPFTNMGADLSQEYFADGITEDLITDLSKIAGLFVIARNSTFAYKGKSVDIHQVAEELGVRYVLEGSVRRSGDQIRINAQLINAISGGHVWADRYDGQLSDVFGLQDKVTRNIVAVLSVRLTASDKERFTHKQTDNAEAYDEFLKGWNRYARIAPDNIRETASHFEKAILLDPRYSRAYAALAATYWQGWRRSWHREMGYQRWHDLRTKAEELLEKALRDPTPLAHQVAADMLLQDQRHDEAITEAERAVAQDPNDADSYIALAATLSLSGRPDEAIPMVERAMRLNPRYPSVYLYELGLAHFGGDRFEEAALSLEKATALNPKDRWSRILLLATYGQLNRVDEAAGVLKMLETHHFLDLTGIRNIAYWYPFKSPFDAARFSDGLRKAGLPD
jgi:adenylate cyclase